MIGRARALVVAVSLALFATSACSSGKAAKPAPPPPATSTTTVASTTTTVPAGTTVTSLLAGVEGDIPGVRLELNALERTTDEVVKLAFTLVNTGTIPLAIADNFGTGGSVDGIAIVDTANEQLLGTLTDDSGVCRCSRGLGTLEPGQRISLFAELGAPPADVGLVSVVVPRFPGVQKIRMS